MTITLVWSAAGQRGLNDGDGDLYIFIWLIPGNREYDSEQLCEILLEMEDDPEGFDNCYLASEEEDLGAVYTVG